MTLRQGQGHQTWYDYVDLKQGYKYAKFDRSRCKIAGDEANVKVLFLISLLLFFKMRKCKNCLP